MEQVETFLKIIFRKILDSDSSSNFTINLNHNVYFKNFLISLMLFKVFFYTKSLIHLYSTFLNLFHGDLFSYKNNFATPFIKKTKEVVGFFFQIKFQIR